MARLAPRMHTLRYLVVRLLVVEKKELDVPPLILGKVANKNNGRLRQRSGRRLVYFVQVVGYAPGARRCYNMPARRIFGR